MGDLLFDKFDIFDVFQEFHITVFFNKGCICFNYRPRTIKFIGGGVRCVRNVTNGAETMGKQKQTETKSAIPLITIVGRPNVGKSTLFNRLLKRRVAIVDDMPGVTRDRIFARCRIEGMPCQIVDTGGLTYDMGRDEIEAGVEKQIMLSINSASIVVFVADAQAGMLHEDIFVAEKLRRSGKPVVMVANKADGRRDENTALELAGLGLGDPIMISALHGSNIHELTERLATILPEFEPEYFTEPPIRFCIVGRPNVGKSSITNAILGQERCVVSSVPGTTRDMVDADFTHDGRRFIIVDTAGVKRKKTKMDNMEYYGYTRAKRSIEDSDLAVLVVDAEDGLLEGEKRIADAVITNKKGLLIAVNKMDLIDNPDYDYFLDNFFLNAPFLKSKPILFVSALERSGMDALLDNIVDVHRRQNELLPLELLKNVIYDTRTLYSPAARKGRVGEILDVIHDSTNPPRIVIRANDPELFDRNYKRLIENRIRAIFNLSGVTLELKFAGPRPRKKEDSILQPGKKRNEKKKSPGKNIEKLKKKKKRKKG